MAQALQRDRRLNHVAGQTLSGLVIIGCDRLALENREARMDPIVHDLNQARRDLFPCEQGLDELVPEQLHEADRIRAGDENKRSIGRNKAVGDQTVQMGMKAGGVINLALQGGDHAGEGAAIAGGILEELLDGGVETLA